MSHADTRRILSVAGPDARSFLQGLVTNDMGRVDRDGIAYAALLTPQGKYLADFFLVRADGGYLIDVADELADGLAQRLGMYRLRAAVEIAESPLAVSRGTTAAPEGALADPRHPALGWRLYAPEALPDDGTDWLALRLEHAIPETAAELLPNESYILEMGFERLNGVDFRKGCYVGQEVTARMKHKTELRKGLARLTLAAPAAPGTKITLAEREVGTVTSSSGDKALAYLRFDRAGDGMLAGGIPVLGWERAI